MKYYKFQTDIDPKGVIDLKDVRVEQPNYCSSCLVITVPNRKNKIVLHLHGCSNEEIFSLKLMIDLANSRSNHYSPLQTYGSFQTEVPIMKVQSNQALLTHGDSPMGNKYLLTKSGLGKVTKQYVTFDENYRMIVYKDSIDDDSINPPIKTVILNDITYGDYDRNVCRCHKFSEMNYDININDNYYNNKYRSCISVESKTKGYKKFVLHSHDYNKENVDINRKEIEGILGNIIKQQHKNVMSIAGGECISLSDFKIINEIGKGAFGRVYLCQNVNTNYFYAMKVIEKTITNEKMKRNTIDNFNRIRNINNPFIINIHYCFNSENNGKLYSIMDYCNNYNLYFFLQHCKHFTEAQSVFYLSEILLGLEGLHNSHIIYSDLKLENILIDDFGHIKIIDFGLSKFLSKNENRVRSNSICGSKEYISPEVINRKGYGIERDYWSLGCLYYELLVGQTPFHNKMNNESDLYDRIKSGNVIYPNSMSYESISLIKELLNVDEEERLHFVKNDLKQHPLFRKHNLIWANVYNKEIIPPIIPKLNENNCDNDYMIQYLIKTKKNYNNESNNNTSTVKKNSIDNDMIDEDIVSSNETKDNKCLVVA